MRNHPLTHAILVLVVQTVNAGMSVAKQFVHVYLTSLEVHQVVGQNAQLVQNVLKIKLASIRNALTLVQVHVVLMPYAM